MKTTNNKQHEAGEQASTNFEETNQEDHAGEDTLSQDNPNPVTQELVDYSDQLEWYTNEVVTCSDDTGLPEEVISEAANDTGSTPNNGGKKGDLLAYILSTGIELFHDQMNQAHARVKLDEGRRIFEIESEDFLGWMEMKLYKHLGAAPTKNIVESLPRELAYKARFDSPEHELSPRAAKQNGAYWYDLDGTRAVKVLPRSWEIVDEPPILFRPFECQRPLPIPERNGDALKILEFVNIQDEADKKLFMCWLVSAFIPDIPVPILVLQGGKGTGKSRITKCVKNILDPSTPISSKSFGKTDDFPQFAMQNRMLAFDNLSTLTDEQSDILCSAITGDGSRKRTLHKTKSTTAFEFQNVFAINGINRIPERPDLLDRSLIFHLDPLPKPTSHENGNRYEEDFEERFEDALPGILGGLLNVLAKTLELKELVILTDPPRMADFARYGAAAAKVFGWGQEEFLNAYRSKIEVLDAAVMEEYEFAEAIIEWMKDSQTKDDFPASLLKKLVEVAKALGIDTRSKRWPKGANKIKKHLEQIDGALRMNGILWRQGEPFDSDNSDKKEKQDNRRRFYFKNETCEDPSDYDVDEQKVLDSVSDEKHSDSGIDSTAPEVIVPCIETPETKSTTGYGDDDSLCTFNAEEKIRDLLASQNPDWAEICLAYWVDPS